VTRRVAAAIVLALVVGVVAAAGCGGDDDSRLTVLGASSLTDVLPAIDASAEYQFAGSDTLAAQIREGAPADVYAGANTRLPDELLAEGLVEKPQVFATNRLVLLVPRGNPASIRTIADLDRDGVRFVMAAEGVPAGDYTREVLAALGRDDLVGRAASYEDDVRGVTGKVALGEADAGFAYATDAVAVGDEVEVVELPARAQAPIRYGIAVVATSGDPDAAQAYVDRVLGPEGRAALEAAGFGLP
jgi:molybdate transport system substrate-binding protein